MNASRDPGTAQYQTDANAQFTELENTLLAVPSNKFSAAWRQTVEEMGIGDLLGAPLAARLAEIISRNEITLAVAAEEIKDIGGLVLRLGVTLDGLLDSFSQFHIGSEELAPGEFEIGFLIPRDAVGNERMALGEEIVRLEKILWPFFELATGTHPPIEVRAISSSNFQIVVSSLAGSALVFAKAISMLVDSYVKVKDLRENAEDLERKNVPPELVESLREHATASIEVDIEVIATQLILEHPENIRREGRDQELKSQLKVSLRAMARRLDKEYGFDVRHGELPLPEDAPEDVTGAAAEIDARREKIRFMNLTGVPVLLQLEAAEEDRELDDEAAQGESTDA